jgi:hypothetical protein
MDHGKKNEPAVDAVDVAKRYGQLVAVDHLSVHVGPGEERHRSGPPATVRSGPDRLASRDDEGPDHDG